MAGGVFALSSGLQANAHEIGTSRVAVLLNENQTYQIEIVTDATALIDKLEASTGRPSPIDASPAALQDLLTGFDGQFRQRVRIAFDGTEAHPSIAYSVAPGTGAGASSIATIRLTGKIPPGAQHFTWTYSWTFASYAMTVRNAASQDPTTQWLEGGQSSAPFALTTPAPRSTVSPQRCATCGSALPTFCPTAWITCCSCSAFSC